MTNLPRAGLPFPLTQPRQATALSLLFVLCFVYVSAESWYCPNNILNTLSSVCGSCYASYDKRTNMPATMIEGPSLEPKNALDFFKRSSSRGIVDECCYKRCDMFEMIHYCCKKKQLQYYTVVGYLKRR